MRNDKVVELVTDEIKKLKDEIMPFLRKIDGGVATLLKLPSDAVIDVPAPVGIMISVDDFFATTDPSLLNAVFSINRPSGNIYFGFSTSSAPKSQASLTDVATVQPGLIGVSEGGLTPGQQYYLDYFYEAFDGTRYPATTTIQHGSTVTLPATETAPTAITPTAINISENQATGQDFAQFVANTSGCTFTKVADPSGVFTLSSAGALRLSSSVLATNSPYSLTVRATNSAGFTEQVVSVPVAAPPASSGSLADDAIVANQSELDALLASWEGAGWDATAAGLGKTSGDERVIELSGTTWASLTANGYTFPQRVTIRPKGPYSTQTVFPWKVSSATGNVTGLVQVNNSTNIRIYGVCCSDYETVGGTDVTFDRMAIQATRGANDDIAPTQAARAINGLRLKFHNNLITGFKNNCVVFQMSNSPDGTQDGFEFIGNIVDKIGSDGLKVNLNYGAGAPVHTAVGWKLEDNWFLDCIPSLTAHPDYFQCFRGVLSGVSWKRNVLMQKRGIGTTGVMNGGFYFSDNGRAPDADVRQNIHCMSGANSITLIGGGLNAFAEDNTLLYRSNGPAGTYQQGAHNPQILNVVNKDRNLVSANTIGTQPGQEGPNGVRLVIGHVWNGVVPNMALYAPYVAGIPTDTTFLDQLKPVSGARTHWDYAGGAGPLGAVERSAEIWRDGLHPGSLGHPVAHYWKIHVDPFDSAPHTFTGTYDNDTGDNV